MSAYHFSNLGITLNMFNGTSSLHNLDFLVIIGYFLLIFGVSIYLIIKDRQKDKGSETYQYYLGGKGLGWFVIGASLFASNIGSEHLVGLAGAGASGDFPVAQFEILAAFMLLLLGWLFVPFYLNSGVFTMPEFLEKRYDRWSRDYLSWVSIAGYILTKISVTIAAGGIIFTTLLGIDFWTGAIIVVVVTGLYTVLGGLKVVVYTDMVQLFVLIAGAVTVTWIGLETAGGWEEVVAKTEPSYRSLWRSMSDRDFPWTGIIFGAPILGVWYWCTDQFIVQRTLAAKNIDQARKGTIFAGFLKLLTPLIIVIPGVIAYTLSTGPDPVLQFPVENGKPVYDAALPLLTMELLPTGLRGVVVAGMIAALMSSLSSVFNSCSTLFAIDIYRKNNPKASQGKLVRVGQVATLVLVALSLAWIPFLKILEGGLFQKLQSIQSYIAPPIAAVFLLGLFSSRLNAKGARYALLTGAVLGLFRLILELNKGSLDGFLFWYTDVNFLHFALFLFIICSVILVLASLFQPSVLKDKSLLVSHSSGKIKDKNYNVNLILSIILVILVILMWIAFR